MSHQRESGFLEKGADLCGGQGNLWGTSGEVWGTCGNMWIALIFHSERSSREVAGELLGKLGEIKSREFPESPGKLDFLPATRQNFVQIENARLT